MKILLPAVTIFLLLFVLTLGCTSSKHVQTSRINTDSVYSHAVDSMVKVGMDIVSRYETKLHNLSTGQVVFDTLWIPGDTITNTVTVHDGDITATGHIKTVYVTSDKFQSLASLWKFKYDSLANHKDSLGVRYVTNTVTVDKVVKRAFIPWWLFAIAGLFALLFILAKKKIL